MPDQQRTSCRFRYMQNTKKRHNPTWVIQTCLHVGDHFYWPTQIMHLWTRYLLCGQSPPNTSPTINAHCPLKIISRQDTTLLILLHLHLWIKWLNMVNKRKTICLIMCTHITSVWGLTYWSWCQLVLIFSQIVQAKITK